MKLRLPHMTFTAAQLRRFHLTMMVIWAILIVPTIIWWHSSILWVAGISVYANCAAHFSAWQGTRAEEEAS